MTRADDQYASGDLVLVNLEPVRGTEQSGTRPALIISDAGMHSFSRRAIVCPITRNLRPWPTKVVLPDGLKVEGAILVDQVRSIDRAERILRYLGRAPAAVVHAVHEKLVSLLGVSFR